MTIEVQQDRIHSLRANVNPDESYCVVLDLLDGRKLKSDPMLEGDAEMFRIELERRIFCIKKDAADGRRDRM